MDTPTPEEGFVVGSWPRSMLVIPVPRRYRFEGAFTERYSMFPVTLIGPHTTPIVSFNEGRRNRGVSLEFTDLGTYQLFGIDQSELTDRMIDAIHFFPREVICELVDAVHQSDQPDRIVRAVQRVLLDYLERRDLFPVHPVMTRVISGNCRANGLPIEVVAREYATTPRTLRRLFDRYVGISPKRYFSIQRVHAVTSALLSGTCRDLSVVAQQFGFHDHAHLDHALRRDLLVQPSALKRSTRHREVEVLLHDTAEVVQKPAR